MLGWIILALGHLFGYEFVSADLREQVHVLQDYDDGLQNAAESQLSAKVIQCWAHASKAIWAKIVSLFAEESRQAVYDDVVKLHYRTCNEFFHYQLKLFYIKYADFPEFKNYMSATYDRDGAKCTWHLGESLLSQCNVT